MYGILFIVNVFILANLGSSEEVVKTCESEDEPTIFLAVRVRRVVRFRVITLTTTTTLTPTRRDGFKTPFLFLKKQHKILDFSTH